MSGRKERFSFLIFTSCFLLSSYITRSEYEGEKMYYSTVFPQQVDFFLKDSVILVYIRICREIVSEDL